MAKVFDHDGTIPLFVLIEWHDKDHVFYYEFDLEYNGKFYDLYIQEGDMRLNYNDMTFTYYMGGNIMEVKLNKTTFVEDRNMITLCLDDIENIKYIKYNKEVRDLEYHNKYNRNGSIIAEHFGIFYDKTFKYNT